MKQLNLKRESVVAACKSLNTLRLLVKPSDGKWGEMFERFDELHETCFETSTRFVRGHNDLVWIPEGQLVEAVQIVELLRLSVEAIDPELGAQAVKELFERLEAALAV